MAYGLTPTASLLSRARSKWLRLRPWTRSQCNEDPVIGRIWGILDFRSFRVRQILDFLFFKYYDISHNRRRRNRKNAKNDRDPISNETKDD